jgi:hypothetical protein
MIEHRTYERAGTSAVVRYWFAEGHGQAVVRELSPAGVFLRTPTVLPEGARLTIRLEVPGLRSMTVMGSVVRTVLGGATSATGMGIAFLHLYPSERENLAAFVSRRPTSRVNDLRV